MTVIATIESEIIANNIDSMVVSGQYSYRRKKTDPHRRPYGLAKPGIGLHKKKRWSGMLKKRKPHSANAAKLLCSGRGTVLRS